MDSRILHLEDDSYVARVVGNVLGADHVVHVTTFKKFQQALVQDGFDLVISDVHVPLFEGDSPRNHSRGVVGEVRRSLGDEVPLVFLTGEPDAVDSDDEDIEVYSKADVASWRERVRDLM